jgi:hypothetical protein
MQTIFDPQAARAFSQMLEQHCKDLAARNAQVSRKFVELRTSWQDRKYDGFTKVFDETTEKLARFLQHAEKYAAYLRAKAAITDKYLGR